MRPKITAMIMTFNEADQIEECLRSLEWCDEILLIDSFSTDGTVELVRAAFPRVRIEQHEYFGCGAQRNWGLKRVATEWILAVDADERVTPELRDEILRTVEKPGFWAYEILRLNYVYDTAVRRGGLQRDWVTRLFHRDHAIWQRKRVHAELDVDGPKGRMRGLLLHYYVRSFNHMVEKMTRYATWSAAHKFRRGQRASTFQLWAHPTGRFLRDYVLWRGFMDGAPGLILTGLHVYYAFWKYAKLWEFTRLERMGRPVPLPRFDDDEATWARPWKNEGRTDQPRTA
jgi:glycosyltransferase involved in cell wall biosynthesis